MIIQIMSHQNQSQPPAPNRFQGVKNGPKHPHNRDCTDVFCCILMVINIGVMVAFALYGYTKGNTNNVYRATDQKADICGATNTVTEAYPYTYFYNPTTGNLDRRTCVTACPGYTNNTLDVLKCYSAGNIQGKCGYDVTIYQNGTLSQKINSSNQIIGYQSSSVIGRVCLPSSTVFLQAFVNYTSTFSGALRQAGVANFITDIQNNWKWLVLAIVLSIVISIIFMFFLRCLAGCFVWLSLLLVILSLLGLAIVFLYNGGAISRSSFVGNLGISIPNLPSSEYYNIFGYIVFGVAALILLIVLCCCSRIRLAVALCGVAGQFIAQTCQIVFVPIIMGFFVVALWVASLFGMVCLIATANFVVNGTDVFTSIQSYTSSSLGYFYYLVFGTLWVNALLMAITIFVIAAACTVWYFSHAPGIDLDSPVCSGFYMAFRCHFGSLSFGSLIIAIIQFVQFIFEIVVKSLKSQGGDQTPCFQYITCCVRCCLNCLQQIMQFLNKNAYIVIAVTGKNFCGASSDAMALIASNPMRYSVVGVVGYILAIIGKITIAVLTTFLFYLFITFVTSVKANIQQPIYMLILVAIGSFAIALIFMSVFDVAVDALLVCFLIDEQSNAKAVYAPIQLRELMDK